MLSVQENKGLYTSKSLLAATVCLVMASQAQAIQLDFGEDSELSGNLDMTLGYAAAIRATDADLSAASLATAPNTASDLRVPDAGDLISNIFKVNAELGLEWRNYGLVGNFAYQYDTEIMHGDQADIGFANGSNWTDAAEDYSGDASDVLDLYVYGTFDIGENPLELRAGKQVINWGEGLFFLDGVSTQVPLNINKLVTPGSELKEAYIGVEGIYAQMGVGDVSSLEAYVQTNWRRAEFPPHATFYGDDLFFRGGQETGARDGDIEADEMGQWGISGRTTVGEDTEVGLYYSRYHETFPFVSGSVGGPLVDSGGNLIALGGDPTDIVGGTSLLGLHQIWPEDLDMIGFSVATTLGTWSVNGEIAYRPDRPLFTDPFGVVGVPGAVNSEEHDTWNATVHGIWLGGALPLGIDSQLALVQFGADYIDGNLSNLAANGSITKEPGLTPDDLAYGVAAEWTGTWQALRPGVDLSLDIFLQYDIDGNSHFWGNFAEDRWLGATTLIANIGNEWEASAGYSWVDQDNSHFDTQDLFNLSVNYKF